MTVEWGKPGQLGAFVMPNPEALAKAVAALQKVVQVSVGLHVGKLDRVIRLSSEGGPVALGFLNLHLELSAPGSLLEPLHAACDVEWAFSATGLVVKAHGDVSPGGPGAWHQRVRLETVMRPDATSPGVVAYAARQTEEYLRVKTRTNKIRLRRVPVFLRLRIVEQARPIGSIPQAHNGQWLPFQA